MWLFSPSPANDYGLFLSDEDPKKGIWLEAGKALDYYMLRNGVSQSFWGRNVYLLPHVSPCRESTLLRRGIMIRRVCVRACVRACSFVHIILVGLPIIPYLLHSAAHLSYCVLSLQWWMELIITVGSQSCSERGSASVYVKAKHFANQQVHEIGRLSRLNTMHM